MDLFVEKYGSYEISVIKGESGKILRVRRASDLFDAFEGEIVNGEKHCPLSNENAASIKKIFPWTAPVSSKGRRFTMGLGDRLGLASKGHIRAIKDTDVFPVLAQQSTRELKLTGRTYDDVISSAVWAAFEERYSKGWGADGDNLKTSAEVKKALSCGCSMITLDCSKHFTQGLDAVVNFAISIYNEHISGKDIDFELSLYETKKPTTPDEHRQIAQALVLAGVKLTSLAPKFCGEFQKGIDYRGDVYQFDREFKFHAQIAEEFGYKLSIHSGSDKFSIFPVIYNVTGRNVHVKTSGTHWLEALRVISLADSKLFREILKNARENLAKAKRHYKISADVANIPDADILSGIEMTDLLGQDDARQVLHITYGVILAEFKERIHKVLAEHEEEYCLALGKHIARHLPSKGI